MSQAKPIPGYAGIVREPADQPYRDRMSGVKDPFGYTCWIATHIQEVAR